MIIFKKAFISFILTVDLFILARYRDRTVTVPLPYRDRTVSDRSLSSTVHGLTSVTVHRSWVNVRSPFTVHRPPSTVQRPPSYVHRSPFTVFIYLFLKFLLLNNFWVKIRRLV